MSENARIFLSAMYSLGGKYVISERNLKEAFDARIDYEVNKNNYRKTSNLFNKTLNELLSAFIERRVDDNSIEYKFFNPSIADFLYFHYSSKNLDEYFNIL